MTDSLGYVVLVLIVYAVAVARVTRLINADTITDPLRVAIERRARDSDRSDRERGRWATLSYFVGCPWCVGMWLALLTTWFPIWLTGLSWWLYPLIAFATSHLVGVCARFADTEDVQIVGA